MRGSWPIEFSSIQSSNKSIYYIYSNPFALFSNPMLFILDPTIKDDALGLPADLGQPDDVLAVTGSLPGESLDGFFASLSEN